MKGQQFIGAPLPLSLFEYQLPRELIAQEPRRPRDASRLMLLPRYKGEVKHFIFREIADLLNPGDLLVVNRTKVIPARLRFKLETGRDTELLFLKALDGNLSQARHWLAMARPLKVFKPGRTFKVFGIEIKVDKRQAKDIEITSSQALWPILQQYGEVPLPPYIKRQESPHESDRDDYQTLFASEPGAVAAPTAGLHFTPAVIDELVKRQIEICELCLHVGSGTFLPVPQEHESDIRRHQMHAEYYEISTKTLTAIKKARTYKKRVIAVGTTTVRALETWATSGQSEGESGIFIYPGFSFSIVDAMITNFHLPRSTLLMLISAFAGRERVLSAYQKAIKEHYRFFSYGDAMLII
ncbi:MAG: tRNA preQ1(34) S-adenosylmethionine ribosyltransferase-isomerase QueA [Deltaproteobacteria bacterium]|nr:tRNA preQ1(34) S-adenosylmethionine ribosyltransferase-isomerase QueA [Deltaproteobacteria bacterium]